MQKGLAPLTRPRENVGGLFGYRDYLQAVGDSIYPEHAVMVEWSPQNARHRDATRSEAVDYEAIRTILNSSRI